MVYLFNNNVTLAQTPQLDAFGRLRVSQPETLFDSQQRFGLDKSFVSNVSTSNASISFIATQSSANLTVNSNVNAFAARESKYVFMYQPGKSQLTLMTFVMSPISSGNLRQRVGYFGSDNGYYLELSDQLYFVQRSNSTGTVTNTPVAQSSWSNDTFLGTGASGITLDITKAQILFFDMEWLGVGSVRCGFVMNDQFIVAHTFQHANISPYAYITTACLPIRYEIQALTNSAPATSNLTQICSTVASEAGFGEPFSFFSNLAYFSSLTVGSTAWVPVISVQLQQSRLDAISLVQQIQVVLTTSDTVQWALWSNVAPGALTNASFSTPPQNGSVQIDKSATALNVTNCWQIASGIATNGGGASTSGVITSLASYFSQIGRDSFSKTSEIFTLALIRGTGSSALTGYALLSWQELL